MQEKIKIFEDLKVLKKEINDLRKNLNSIDDQKESWFDKKEEYGSSIRELIKNIKDGKAKRDELTKRVKENKKERDELNQKIKAGVSKLKELNEEKSQISKERGEDPSRIKETIEKLDLSIETDAMSFENEKKVMKRINELKKKFKEAEIKSEAYENFKKVSKGIDNFKKEANLVHLAMQGRARESQKLHESLVANSKEIDKLKVEEEKAFERFIEFKKKFTEVNSLLKEKLTKLGEIKKKLDGFRLKDKEKRKLDEESFIKSKEAEVEEKIKKGGKLTTEDLLVFQNKR